MKPGLLSTLPPPPPGRTGWPWTEEVPPEAYAGRTDWPRLVVVTPSYGQAAYLEETLRSVLLQNYPNLAYVVMDGGSTDGSRELIERYAPWLHAWASERDRGQTHAINKGFAAVAPGDLHGWVNSDDYYLPEAFLHVARAFNARRRRPLFVYGHYLDMEFDGRCVPVRMPPVFAFEVYSGGLHLASHATFWRGDAHVLLNESLRFIMDADLFKRIAARGGRCVRVERELAVFRKHPQSKTSTILDVARAETEAWLASAPRDVRFYWQLHRLLKFVRRFV